MLGLKSGGDNSGVFSCLIPLSTPHPPQRHHDSFSAMTHSVMTTADAEFRTREPLMAVKRFYHSTKEPAAEDFLEETNAEC